jgi:hypothetical protein
VGAKGAPKDMSAKLESIVRSNSELRSYIISIGIPILLADGKTLLRGKEIKIPPYRGENELKITDKSIDAWAHDGWVDLRPKNMERWKTRFERIMNDVTKVAKGDTSSRHFRTKAYWNDFEDIDPGKLAGWIFGEEEKGARMKA